MAVVCWSVWHLWQPQGMGRMVPEMVWTGTRPSGSAGEARGWWLHHDTTRRVPGLCGGAAGESVTRTSLHPQPLSGPLPFVFGCSLPSQALPACCCCPTSTWSSYFVSMQLLFFLDRSSDVQEKIIKANQPVRQHFLLLTPVCIPAENTPPVIRSHWLLCGVPGCWLRQAGQP